MVNLVIDFAMVSGGAGTNAWMTFDLVSGSATAVLAPNTTRVSINYYIGTSSFIGIFRATADGNLTFQPRWAVTSGDTAACSDGNIVAWVIGKG